MPDPSLTSPVLRFGSLFSGIGGLDLGLERAGMECAWQVENNEWCRKVLEKHWPNVPRFNDVKEVSGNELGPVDLICGGFPCQPVSLAGRRLAQDDERWLWPHFARLIRELRPRFALMENVPGLLSAGFGDVLGDLASLGYDAEWECVPAAAVGAPHLRWRVFIVADSGSPRRRQDARGAFEDEGQHAGWPTIEDHIADCDGEGDRARHVADSDELARTTQLARQGRPEAETPRRLDRADGRGSSGLCDHWAVEPDVGRVADGIPKRMDRLRGLGNAVVPQVAEYVGRRIMAAA